MSGEKLKKLKKGLLAKKVALEKIQPFEGCKEHLIQGKVRFAMHSSKEDHFVMTLGKMEYILNEFGLEKVCRLVGIPSTYTRKIPKQYLFPHLSYWIGDGDVPVKALIREGAVDKDGRETVSGFLREDSYYYPISRVLEQVDKVDANYMVEGLEDVNWRNSSFGLVFPEFEYDIEDVDLKRGDFIYGGVKIKDSILGEAPLKISAFLLTLACMNGVVSVDEIYTFNRKQGFGGQDDWIVDGVQKAIGVLKAEVEKVRQLVPIKITNEELPPYITHIFDQAHVNQKSREAILAKILERNPRNFYQLANAITETAHTIENRGEVFALQQLGGFVSSHAIRCKKCNRPFD